MPKVSESAVVFLVGAVQFVNILDFLMVMPLGPDFAQALHIPTSMIAYIGGSYTASAAVAGLLGALFLERFDRRPALAVAMLGLVLGTLAGGFAIGFKSLIAARLVAGFFGGPATSLSFSIIADVIPAERRGKAMGAVMGAFSIASIAGVPLGLELARRSDWRMPFFAVATLGLFIAGAAIFLLPSLRLHLDAKLAAAATLSFPPPKLFSLLAQPLVQLSYVMTATVMMAGFLLIPNLSTYIQMNLHFPRERLGTLYLAGGLVSLVTLRMVGRLVDRFGSFRVGAIGSVLLLVVMQLLYVAYRPIYPLPLLFASFMFAMSFRNVSYNTLASKVPLAHERAAFMSLQSSVQHIASSSGAFLSAHFLTQLPDGSLVGLRRIAMVSMMLTAFVPVMLRIVEERVKHRNRR